MVAVVIAIVIIISIIINIIIIIIVFVSYHLILTEVVDVLPPLPAIHLVVTRSQHLENMNRWQPFWRK